MASRPIFASTDFRVDGDDDNLRAGGIDNNVRVDGVDDNNFL